MGTARWSSVVDRDVRPYAIVSGNRAEEKRRRFSDKEIEILLRTRWWDRPDVYLRAHLGAICGKDIKALDYASGVLEAEGR